MNLAILIPTYNEASNIEKLLRDIASIAIRNTSNNIYVYVIDDSSPDGTAIITRRIGAKLSKSNFHVNLILRNKKEGIGKAYLEGFQVLFKSSIPFDYALQMDSDLSHNPEYIDMYIGAAQAGADFVIGSRYIPGGSIPNWGLHRRLLSKGGNLFAQLILGKEISDYTGGYNMFSLPLLRKINYNRININGYGFLIALKYHALKYCTRIIQLPIVFHDRLHGNSKMPIKTIISSFILVLQLRLTLGRRFIE